LAVRASELLQKHYPGYIWAVNVNSEKTGGVMTIKNFSVSYQWGMILHLDKLDAKLKKVVRAGGELLERGRMARGLRKDLKAAHVDGIPDKFQRNQHARNG
jgi:predicted enzyme related to lactoylglutathione lyase